MEDIKAQFNQFAEKVTRELEERRAELDRRAAALDRREAELEEREKELSERLARAEQDTQRSGANVTVNAASAAGRDHPAERAGASGGRHTAGSGIAGAARAAVMARTMAADEEDDEKEARAPNTAAQSRLFTSSGAATAAASTGVKGGLFASPSVATKSSLFGSANNRASSVTKEVGKVNGAYGAASNLASQGKQLANDDSAASNSSLFQAPTPARAATPTSAAASEAPAFDTKEEEEASVDTGRLRQLFEKKKSGEDEAAATRRKTWTPVTRDVPLPAASSAASAVAPSSAAGAEETDGQGQQSSSTVKVNARTGDGGTAYRPNTVFNKSPPQRRSLQELLNADQAKAKECV